MQLHHTVCRLAPFDKIEKFVPPVEAVLPNRFEFSLERLLWKTMSRLEPNHRGDPKHSPFGSRLPSATTEGSWCGNFESGRRLFVLILEGIVVSSSSRTSNLVPCV